MKRFACLMLAAGSALAMPAHAQISAPDGGDEVRYAVIGSAPEFCLLGEPSQANATSPAINFSTVIGRVVSIEEMADPETLSTRGASIELSFEAVCNFPHQITLESDNNGLFRQSTSPISPLGFANAVPYSAELTRDEESIILDADALTRRPSRALVTSSDASAGPLLLRLAVLPGATNITTLAPLLAGEYRDTLRITVGPR